MRLFIAITFNQETRKKIHTVQQRLIQRATRVSPVPPEQFHLTLVFLGEIDKQQLSPVKKVIAETDFSPMKLLFDHVGRFQRKGGDIWWLGTAEHDTLNSLRAHLVSQLVQRELLVNKTAFTPHVTLARHVLTEEAVLPCDLLTTGFSTVITSISLIHSANIAGKTTYTEIFRKTP